MVQESWLKQKQRGTFTNPTTPLRVFFDTLEDVEKHYSGHSGSGALVKRYATFRGESMHTGDCDVIEIFLLPIRRIQHDELCEVAGLLLVPTTRHKGQFNRVGQFECRYPGYGSSTSHIEYLSSSTDVVDDRFFISKEGSGDNTEDVVSIV